MHKMQVDMFTTIREGQDWVNEHKREGAKCPCCDQVVKIYKRKLNSGMARELIGLYQVHMTAAREMSDKSYFHHSEFSTVTSGEIAKLKHWGLVVPMDKSDVPEKKTKTSGYWALTGAGLEFVRHNSKAPAHIFMDQGECIGKSDEMITIIDALGDDFNYHELMNA